MVACARFAASTMDAFTTSRLLRASASQSNSSSSRCRPSACTLSLLPVFFLPEKFPDRFLSLWANSFFIARKKWGFIGLPAGRRTARRGLRGPPTAAAGHFLLAFASRAVSMSEDSRRLRRRGAAAHKEARRRSEWVGLQ